PYWANGCPSLCADGHNGGDGYRDRRVTRRIAAAADPPRSELSPVRRPAHFVRHAELLECRFESSLHRGRCGGTAAISPRPDNHRALSGDTPDRLRLVLLSL